MMNSISKAISLQVMWNRLLSVVEEQAQTLIRTSFSPVTRDAGDLSAGVFTPEGEMLAQAVTGTPGHVNAMARSVGHFLAVLPADDWAEGDVAITNDPWIGTGHLNDFCVVTPIFRKDRLIGFFACTTHIVDVGGQGVGFDGRDVFHEGIRIPVLRLLRKGQTDANVEQILRANVRFPDLLMGEIFALIAANQGGCRALLRMCDEFALTDLAVLAEFIFERSSTGMRAAIATIPEGCFDTAMRIDLVGEPIEVTARMTVTNGMISLDLGGELTPHPRGVNVPFCYTEAYAAFGIRCIVGPDIPNNAASLGAVRISAPEGSILNARFPAPVASRHILGHMMADLALGCLAAAVPDRVPAEHSGTLWNLRLARNEGPRPFNILCFHSGGGGARPAQDGLAATAYPSGVQSIPIEVSERAAPILYRQRALRPDSGGSGTWRGGLGQIIEVTSSDGMPIEVGASFQRVLTPARGRNGGSDGAPGMVRLSSGAPFRAAGRQTIPVGDSLIIETPGGGGFGDPHLRATASIAADVRRGLVTPQAAQRDYSFGVEIIDSHEKDIS
jgi:N-methylhydantoinase B/oxoprolinase/acetone carboxylase alpha subunit